MVGHPHRARSSRMWPAMIANGVCAWPRLRISRYWPWSVFAAVIAIRRRNRRMVKQADRIGRDLAESVVFRWRETDERTDALIDLTRTLKRLTWVLLVVGLATLVVAILALARG
jgi:hypothetical protein